MATIKDLKRMCKNMKCKDCPLSGSGDVTDCRVMQPPATYPDDVDEIVDKWVETHPVKTYMQDFFEKFPNAGRNEKNIPATKGATICRKSLYVDTLPCIFACDGCSNCWNQEMKEE